MKIWAIPTAIAVTDHDAALDGRIARPGQPALDQKPVQRCEFQLEHIDTRVRTGNLPQYRRNLFPSLTVRHNLELGGITLPRGELPGRMEEVLQRFPRIRERLDNQASTMSGGEQKQLEIGRALLLRPRVLLIDEPSIGLSPILVRDVMTLLRGLADAGTTILMVEQNVRTALKYSNRALVLEMGRLALDRPASELLGDPNLNRLFLGAGTAKAAPAAA